MNTGEYSPADNDIRFHIDTTIQADEQMERSHDADRQAISSMQSPVGVDTQGLSASEASQAVAGQKLINRKLDKDISRNIAFSSVNRLAVQSVYNKMWEPFWLRGLKKIPGLQKILPEKLNTRKAYEALFDSMTTLHDLIDDIEQKYGKLPEELNFYWAENASMSIVQDATDKFNEQYLQPLLDTLAKVRKAFENKDYMLKYYPLAKSGIERQLVQKERRIAEAKADPQYDGKPEKLQAAIDEINSRDFAGLTGTFQFMLREEYPQMQFPENFDKFEYEDLEQYAAENHLMNLFDFVKKSEDTLGRQLTNELWQRVRDISAYQLERKLQKGLISKDTYELLTYGTPMSEILKKNKNEEITKVNQTLTNKDEIDKAIDGIEKKYGIYIEGYFTHSQLLKKGLITQEQFDSLHRLYDFYVPMKGQTDVSAEDINEYERRERKNLSDLKKIKGHENMVRDPFTQLIQDTYGTIINGEQNAWKQRLLETCRRYSMPVYHLSETWLKKEKINGKEVFTPYLRKEEGITYLTPTQQEIDNGTAVKHRRGLDLDIPIVKAHEHEHAVTVFENGRPITIWFTDPAISRAVNKLNISAPIDNKFTRVVQAAQRLLAATMTTLNISFTVPNVLKDYQEANANLLIKEGRKYQARFNKNYFDKKLQGAVRRRLAGKPRDTEYDKLVDEYFRNGGPVAYNMLADYQKQLESLRKDIKKTQRNKKLNLPKNAKERAGDLALKTLNKSSDFIGKSIENLNKSAELAARIATYATSRQMGRSVTRSIWDSKEVTVNFDKKGTMSRTLGYWQLFWNAGRQSNRNQLQMIKDHPWRWLAVKSLTTSIGASEQALTILAAFLLGGDDDDAEKALDKYYSLTPYIRYSNFCVVAGDQVITIPLPPAFLPSHTLGVCIGEFITRSNKPGYSTTNALIDVASAAGKEWLPECIAATAIARLEGKDFKLSRMITQPLAKPFLEAYDNINFMDRPIYKDKANKNLPEYQRIYKGVPKGYIQISKGINDITGGNEIERGWISPNPAAIEHVVNGYVNGLGKIIEQLANLYSDPAPQHIPVLSRFWRGDVELYLDRDDKNSYYRLLEEAKEFRRLRNEYGKDPAKYSKELQRINHKEALYDYVLDAKKELDQLNEAKETANEKELEEIESLIKETYKSIFEVELELHKKQQ
ncbi:LPD38 domain-containing protein [Gabonia massiliensis]|uniref:LPD38 domain-containing protein n=1 Tax=Gabonia massiliensis TaxID=1686296 RepID=UPI00214ACA62|nr:LPD38 domain-containing protein [Gabonia massiliensis]